MQDYHLLPKLRDSLSYLYIEHAVIEREQQALQVLQQIGRTAVPIANLNVLLLGPGVSLTHAAVALLATNGVSLVWVGEDGNKCYAQGGGETRRAGHLIQQAALVSDPEKRLGVVLRMYAERFGHELEPNLSLEQIRGMEGARMKRAYQEAARQYGVEWNGRVYDRRDWAKADPVNRALSAANALLNGLCHAAIVSGGYSPGLGFLHTGLQLSFVYDIADLYKTRYTIPVAFFSAADGMAQIEKRTRQLCRELFRQEKLLEQILPDIDRLLQVQEVVGEAVFDQDVSLPSEWWQPEEAEKEG